jgi:hypothetical protein
VCPADAGSGLSAPVRQRLTARRLGRAVGTRRHLKVYSVGVQLSGPLPLAGAPSAPHPRYCIDGGRRYPRRYQVAEHQLANRHERESSKPALPLSACVQPTNLLSRSDSAIGAAVTHAAGFNNASEAPRFSTSPPKCRIDLPGKVE